MIFYKNKIYYDLNDKNDYLTILSQLKIYELLKKIYLNKKIFL